MVKIKITLDQLLKNKNMSQKDLVELIFKQTQIKVRPASISELYNNQRKSLNKELIELIATALNVKDINEIISLEDSE